MIARFVLRGAVSRRRGAVRAPARGMVARRGGKKGRGSGRAGPQHPTSGTDPGVEEARAWAATFRAEDIPRAEFRHSFVRSSGPGGQNVNKVSTKAEIRFELDRAGAWLPAYARRAARAAYGNRVNKAGELVIASEVHRTQAQNLEDAYARLHAMLVAAGTPPAETSAEKRREVDGMRKKADERRLREKRMRSERKSQKGSRREKE